MSVAVTVDGMDITRPSVGSCSETERRTPDSDEQPTRERQCFEGLQSPTEKSRAVTLTASTDKADADTTEGSARYAANGGVSLPTAGKSSRSRPGAAQIVESIFTPPRSAGKSRRRASTAEKRSPASAARVTKLDDAQPAATTRNTVGLREAVDRTRMRC